jgi:hypothetical protein
MDLTDTSILASVKAQIGSGPWSADLKGSLIPDVYTDPTTGKTQKVLTLNVASAPMLKDILPPTSWAGKPSNPLRVTATPSASDTSAGSNGVLIVVKQLNLVLNASAGSSVTSTQFTLAPDDSGHSITAADGIVKSIALTDKGGKNFTETYDPTTLELTATLTN